MSAAPAARTTIVVQAGLRSATRVRARRLAWGRAVSHAALFGGVLAATNLACGLLGHVLLENSRRECIAARERAAVAKQSAADLKRAVEAMSNYAAVESWARSHGFVASDAVPVPSGGWRNVAARIP